MLRSSLLMDQRLSFLEEWVRIQLDEESNNRVIKSLHLVSGISRYWFLVGVDSAHRPRIQRWILGVEDVMEVTRMSSCEYE